MKKKSTISNPKPEIGMGVTWSVGSDRYPGTIVEIYHNDKRIVIQEDIAIRTDDNGMSESQTYKFETNPSGTIYHASLRKDGRWKLMGTKQSVSLGIRGKYYDFSF
jgi:hypothetical protein